MDKKFQTIIRNFIKECYKETSNKWIIEPNSDDKIDENGVFVFNGAFFLVTEARSYPGKMFRFKLQIEQESLSSPPKIVFDEYIYHPYVQPYPPYNLCFPQNSLTCFSNLVDILNYTHRIFMLDTVLTNNFSDTCLNTDAYDEYKKIHKENPKEFSLFLKRILETKDE